MKYIITHNNSNENKLVDFSGSVIFSPHNRKVVGLYLCPAWTEGDRYNLNENIFGGFMNENFMKEKPVFPLLMSMALPMVISMMVNALYNIVDSFFVAKISEDAMTALSYVFPLQNLVNAVAIGFGVGINAVIAIYLGAKDNERADRAASWGMFLAVIQGIVMTVVCIAIIPSFLRAFKANGIIQGMRSG